MSLSLCGWVGACGWGFEGWVGMWGVGGGGGVEGEEACF